jgi:uncharacterized protein YycO
VTKVKEARTFKLWRFDPAALEPGDVVLESGDSLFGKAIKIAEWGRYSHALLWLGGTDFLEAVSSGARVISVQRLIVADPDKWALLRLSDGGGVGEKAADKARNLAHLPYSFSGAVRTKLPFGRSEGATALFCSQLVALAYQQAGVDLVDGSPPGDVTPKKLHTKSRLQLIEPKFIEVGEFDLTPINRDVGYTSSLTYADLVISQDALRLAIPLLPKGKTAGNLVQLYEVLGTTDAANAEPVSKALLEFFDREGYFDLIENEAAGVEAWLQEQLAAVPVLEVADRDALQSEMNTLSGSYAETADRHKKMAACYANAFSHGGLALWKRLSQSHAGRAALFAKLAEQAAAVAGGKSVS